MQVEVNQVQNAIAAKAAKGGKAFEGVVRNTFDGNQQGLTAGTYVPVNDCGNAQLSSEVQQRNGRKYEALTFSMNGREVQVSTGSLFNKVRVVDSILPAALTQGQKWLGESANPTREMFRYGDAMAQCDRDTIYVDGVPHAVYAAPTFTLTVERVYVVPRFVEGSNRPVYDEQCELRKAWFAQ